MSDIQNYLERSLFGGLRNKDNASQLSTEAGCISVGWLEIVYCAFSTFEGLLLGRNKGPAVCESVNALQVLKGRKSQHSKCIREKKKNARCV